MYKKKIFNNLSNTEEKTIEQKYNTENYLNDEIIKLRIDNLQKIQPFIKVNKKKKRRIKKKMEENYQTDPFKFREIPKDMNIFIKNILNEYNIGQTTLAYKLNIDYNIIDSYLNKNDIIDNYILYKILNYINYDLDKKKINNINNKTEIKYNKQNIIEDNKTLKLEYLDLDTIDLDKI